MNKVASSLAASAAIASVLVVSPRASAVIQNTWQLAPPAVGNFSDAANWTVGAPTGDFGNIAAINNGGTAAITQDLSFRDLVLGQGETDSGQVVQTDHRVTLAGDLYLGEFGQGEYLLSGGELRGGEIFIAPRPDSQGTLRIDGGIATPGYLFLGQAVNVHLTVPPGTATVYQSAGTVEVFYAGLVIRGENSSYHLSGGTVRALDQVITGDGSNIRFVQTGGTNDAHNPSGGGYYSGAVRVGIEADQQASYELSGGSLLTNYTAVGAYRGQGRFVETGGLHHVFGDLAVGGEQMGTGEYELHGGQLIVDNALNVGTRNVGSFSIVGAGATIQARDLNVGAGGTVSFVVDAAGVAPAKATRNVSIAGILALSDEGAANGTYLLIDAANSLTFQPADIQLPGPNWSVQQLGPQVYATRIPEPLSADLSCLGAIGVALYGGRRLGRPVAS